MSSPILNQLIEIFPDVSEEFLQGICDAHKDEDVTLEEIIEVILLFEFRPPRENMLHQLEENLNSGNQTIVQSEGSSTINVKINGPVENESLQQAISTVNDASKINAELNKTELGLQLSNIVSENHSNLVTSSNVDNGLCSPLQDQYDGNEDDSSPECSIKYLMEEWGIMERCNIKTECSELKDNPEESVSPQNNNRRTDELLCSSSITNSCQVNRKGSLKFKNLCTLPKKSVHPTVPHKSSSQALPHFSVKRVTLRSCKIKVEEKRSSRKVLNKIRPSHRKEENNSNSSNFLDIESKYTLLCRIFTDANPTYLLDQCEFLTDHEKILAFIYQNLELRDYPKVEIVNEEPKLMDEFHCTIADFVQVIPDPEAEFSNSNYLRIGYQENAEIYLKARYNNLSDEDIKKWLEESNYNLLAVCTRLEDEGMTPTPNVLTHTPLHHPASVFFHQEVWYIEHRKEVQDYLGSALEAIRIEEELNRPPPPPEEVFECEICASEVIEYTDLGTCDGPSGHLFCKDCIRRSAEIKIGEGETKFPCLKNCSSFIPLQTIQEVVSPNLFSILMDRIQEEEIRKANIAGVETCPFCPFAYGPGEESLFTCQNPKCMKLSCRICRKEEHSPEICDMFKNEDEEKARIIIENRMAEALMRTCHNCGKNIIKAGGCNKMQCLCGAKMCYVCRQPVLDYTHFNGQGGDNLDRCPLFANDDELHERPVEAAAEQVFNEIAANNPQLNLSRAKLIPK